MKYFVTVTEYIIKVNLPANRYIFQMSNSQLSDCRLFTLLGI